MLFKHNPCCDEIFLPIEYTTAVKAIQAATNLALGFTLNINTPLIMIPRPITNIPPTPVNIENHIKAITSNEIFYLF